MRFPPPPKGRCFTAHFDKTCQDESFVTSIHFSDIIKLYVFDKKLRLLILDSIERIEVAFRTHLAYLIGQHDKFGHKNTAFFDKRYYRADNGQTSQFQKLQEKSKLSYSSKIDDNTGFKKHFHDQYNGMAPIWVVAELWDFGTLSHFYKGLKLQHKKIIADQYHLHPQLLESWLHTLNFIRNVCAHHARLWNINIVRQPILNNSLPKELRFIKNAKSNKLYPILIILSYFLQRISPNSSWKCRLRDLLMSLPKIHHTSLKNMGFPDNWTQDFFWETEVIASKETQHNYPQNNLPS